MFGFSFLFGFMNGGGGFFAILCASL